MERVLINVLNYLQTAILKTKTKTKIRKKR